MQAESAWSEAIREAARALWKIELHGPVLEPPSDPKFGDASCTAPLRLARELRKSPRIIATELADHLRASGLPHVERIEVAGAGYVNLTAAPSFHHEELRRILEEGPEYGRSKAGGGLRALVEHCSANPTGPLHIAHGRQAAVGDSLANILDFAGYRVEREFYVNDTGNQIDMLGKSILWRLSNDPEPPDENCYRGDYIKALAEEFRVLGQPFDLEHARTFGREKLLERIGLDLEAFGVRYDTWTSQEVLEQGGKVEALMAFYRDRGLVYEKDGATWLRTKDLGDTDDKVLVKSDSTYAYRTPDLAYHRDKYERGFELLVDLWGPDHHAHIATMRAGLKALGYNLVPAGELRPAPETKPVAFEVLLVGHCRLLEAGKELKMSKRAASYVTLRELFEEVGVDAARFFFVMRKPNSSLDFDLDVAKKQSLENPVYYAQYAHARIASIWRKGIEEKKLDAGELKGGVWKGAFDPSGLGPDEIELLRAPRAFRRRIEIAARDLDPAVVVEFLRELSGAYQRYYEKGNRDASKRVLAEDEKVRRARLAASGAVQQVLVNGFRLLGVSAPERM